MRQRTEGETPEEPSPVIRRALQRVFSSSSLLKTHRRKYCIFTYSAVKKWLSLCHGVVSFKTFIFCSSSSSSPPFTSLMPLLRSTTPVYQDGNHGIFQSSFIADENSTLYSSNSLSTDNTSFTLAFERTKRKDPTKLYNYYTGGWNISDEHYWASAAFSAIPIFVIAFAWFVGFGAVMLFSCCCSCCCRQRRYSYSRYFYAFSLLMLIVFTCTAIIGCMVLYNIQGKFHNSTITTLDFVKGQSNFIVNNLQNFSRNMAGAKSIGVHQVFLPAELQAKIGDTVKAVTISSDELSSRTSMNLRNIDNFLKSVRIDLIIGSAVMLLLDCNSLSTVWFSLDGFSSPVHSYCVEFFFFYTSDTCVAMDEWVLKPHIATAIDDILPCVDAVTATESLTRSKEVASELAKVVNDVIVNVSNAKFHSPIAPASSNYNQSGPLMPMLCNPYESDLRDRKCLPGEVSFEDAPKVWKGFICNTNVISGKEICSTVGRITPSIYREMMAATSMSQNLYQFSPFLINVANCSFERETFSLIGTDYCPGLERHSKGMYCSLTVFSASMILSLIFWMVYVRERRHRWYSKQFIAREGQAAQVEENKL
ncbi:hypothetical protein IEQ34_013535 [Dendrobium chrysotoxum]|uniref:Uncharacterized protein n=1 Tax=Dendrobium chrysotoxum TaxID=161865 RepID=A0AAV7G948_DENCH|nr:hypothetical protein IEQ34_013535 [Dendrobium chrysotoxum]